MIGCMIGLKRVLVSWRFAAWFDCARIHGRSCGYADGACRMYPCMAIMLARLLVLIPQYICVRGSLDLSWEFTGNMGQKPDEPLDPPMYLYYAP